MNVRWNLVGGILSVVFAFAVGCGSSGDPPTASISASPNEPSSDAGGDFVPSASLNGTAGPVEAPVARKNLFPEVLIKTSAGDVRVRLNAEKAPETVDNFLENYVERGFYPGTIFHHVDEGMVIAGGFTEDLKEKEVRAAIRNESAIHDLKNKRGTIAMFRLQEYADSATSQFFINLLDNDALDYDESTDSDGYCVFGEVVDGMQVLEQVAKSAVHESGGFPSLPVTPVVITSVERIPD
jgi:cyclophilin family peptidyl-prolyl cis-trans isomerase